MVTNPYLPILDSNILISFLSRDERFEITKSLVEYSGYINNMVMAEVTHFFQNKYSPYHSLQMTQYIFSKPKNFLFLEITPQHQRDALEIMQKYNDNALSFTDCILLSQAQQYNLSLITFDQRMQTYPTVTVEVPIVKNNSY